MIRVQFTALALACAALLAFVGPADAQDRGQKRLGPKVSVKVIGLTKTSLPQLEERLVNFDKKGVFKASLRGKGFVFQLNAGQSVSWSELREGIEGEDRRFALAEPTVVGKVSVALHEDVLMAVQGRERMRLAQTLRGLKGVSGLRPNREGAMEMTVAAPGWALSKLSEPVGKAARLKKDQQAVADVTWYGPKETEEKKGSGRRKGGGSKK